MKVGALSLPRAGVSHTVGIGEYHIVTERNGVLISYGLGSCVALCLWEPIRCVGGMAHIMLPASAGGALPSSVPAKFADQALAGMLEEFDRLRLSRGQLVAKIAGGAQMFAMSDQTGVLAVGRRNVERVLGLLRQERIPVIGEHTGGSVGRTVVFVNATGRLHIQTIGSGEDEI
jgi:chemotaxis protein CheD